MPVFAVSGAAPLAIAGGVVSRLTLAVSPMEVAPEFGDVTYLDSYPVEGVQVGTVGTPITNVPLVFAVSGTTAGVPGLPMVLTTIVPGVTPGAHTVAGLRGAAVGAPTASAHVVTQPGAPPALTVGPPRAATQHSVSALATALVGVPRAAVVGRVAPAPAAQVGAPAALVSRLVAGLGPAVRVGRPRTRVAAGVGAVSGIRTGWVGTPSSSRAKVFLVEGAAIGVLGSGEVFSVSRVLPTLLYPRIGRPIVRRNPTC